jgi:hypothetical protein
VGALGFSIRLDAVSVLMLGMISLLAGDRPLQQRLPGR